MNSLVDKAKRRFRRLVDDFVDCCALGLAEIFQDVIGRIDALSRPADSQPNPRKLCHAKIFEVADAIVKPYVCSRVACR